MTANPDLPPPTMAQIESAWIGKPVARPDPGPPPPQLPSKIDRQINFGLVALTWFLLAFVAASFPFRADVRLVFAAAGVAMLTSCLHALRTRRIIGLVRSFSPARREQEPGQYWIALSFRFIWGMFATILAAIALLGGHRWR